jgi:hypothetical protein
MGNTEGSDNVPRRFCSRYGASSGSISVPGFVRRAGFPCYLPEMRVDPHLALWKLCRLAALARPAASTADATGADRPRLPGAGEESEPRAEAFQSERRGRLASTPGPASGADRPRHPRRWVPSAPRRSPSRGITPPALPLAIAMAAHGVRASPKSAARQVRTLADATMPRPSAPFPGHRGPLAPRRKASRSLWSLNMV